MLLPFGDEADLTYYKPRAKDKMLPPLGHFQKEWINACKGSLKTSCDFDYSGKMIEKMLLGLVAYRVGKKIDYDGATGRVTNSPEANDLLRRKYRAGLDPQRVAAPRRGYGFGGPVRRGCRAASRRGPA